MLRAVNATSHLRANAFGCCTSLGPPDTAAGATKVRHTAAARQIPQLAPRACGGRGREAPPGSEDWAFRARRDRAILIVKYQNPPVSPCCDIAQACVFSKALVARAARCDLSQRTCSGDGEGLTCTSPGARASCGTLATLLHERARSALRLPPPGRPLIHVHALRLQCGGLAALQQVLASDSGDVHRLVSGARERHGALADLPWEPLVAAAAQWQPGQRRTVRS